MPVTPFRIPPGIRLVWVDRANGERTAPGAEGAVLEAFLPGTEPGSGYRPPVAEAPAQDGGEAAGNGDAEAGAASGAGADAGRPKPPSVENIGGGGLY